MMPISHQEGLEDFQDGFLWIPDWRIFCANLPSQQARGASYNLLLSLRKGYLFRHRSWCYRLSSSSISPESIKSLQDFLERNRTSRLSRGNLRLQRGLFLSTVEQQRRKREHPKKLQELNQFLSKWRKSSARDRLMVSIGIIGAIIGIVGLILRGP